ncbi:3-keto-disaccharide hydrolase [Roseiconus lacunae]|uniref:DUF1080 domain-containing protein n=1 Tax=Roseiconus lacunae TaxID=2605694 RepID=A0ABT7PHQ9_9BACT|nr:DUF1080 domain-containing protein [Roseiconus lacunae]MCD0461207.1 DUF1080 domain-containing protein [Roseiconus lacunae]MDM4016033.1 DUF1080 domain-containing protein [Roseiconus lacunae]WRQ51633.1 DUF1080 domain-containing protein [Stieleria sp. HD01]
MLLQRLKTTLATTLAVTLLSTVTSAEEVPIFDGKSINNWNVKPTENTDGHWKVEDGVIIAENINEKGSVLWTDREFTNYELELEYQTPSDYYDTGVMLRGDGHQVQIGISGSLKKDMTGCIYAPKDKRGSYPAQTDKIAKVHHVGQWNHLRIVLKDKRIQTFLNGEAFVDYTGIAINDKGPIGLQLHAGHHMLIRFRNLKLKEL